MNWGCLKMLTNVKFYISSDLKLCKLSPRIILRSQPRKNNADGLSNTHVTLIYLIIIFYLLHR